MAQLELECEDPVPLRAMLSCAPVFLILAALLPFAACSAGNPFVDQPDVNAIVHELHPLVDGGFIRIENATKLDGMTHDFMGMKIYELEWRVDVQLLKPVLLNRSPWDSATPCQAAWTFSQAICNRLSGKTESEEVKPGEKIRVWGKANFERKESGWHIAERETPHIECSSRSLVDVAPCRQ